MKGKKIVTTCLLFLIMVTGCSGELSDKMGAGSNGGRYENVEISFHIGTRSGLQTRAHSRPVESSDNWQRVTNMRIYVFHSETGGDDDTYLYQPEIDNGKGYLYISDFEKTKENWKPNDVWGDEDTEKESEQYRWTTTLELKTSGYYKFLAVGRDDIDEPVTAKRQKEAMTTGDGSDRFDDIVWDENTTLASASIIAPEHICHELFSGCSSPFQVSSETQAYSASIELKRAVAGMLLYVKNIPSSLPAIEDIYNYRGNKVLNKNQLYDVDGFAIVTANKTDGILLKDRTYNEENLWTDTFLEYHFVFIDRDDLKTHKTDADGYYVNEDGTPYAHLAGNFIVPQPVNEEGLSSGRPEFSKNEKFKRSLYLVFYHSKNAGSHPFHWLPIKCKTDYVYDQEEDNYNPGNGIHAGEKDYYFPLKANHFYSLGKKNKALGWDEPIDLKKVKESDAEIVIQIDPFWNEYYGGNIGDSKPGIGLDEEWGEHPGGELKGENNNK